MVCGWVEVLLCDVCGLLEVLWWVGGRSVVCGLGPPSVFGRAVTACRVGKWIVSWLKIMIGLG